MAQMHIAKSVLDVWLISLFLYTSVMKLIDIRGIGSSVSAYGLVKGRTAAAAGVLVVGAELAGVAWLLSPSPRIGAMLAVGISAVLLTANLRALTSGKAVPCGCAGRGSGRVNVGSVTRCAAMLAAAIVLAVTTPPIWSSGGRVALVAAGALLVAFRTFSRLQNRRSRVRKLRAADMEIQRQLQALNALPVS
jgi:hypothetical protein